MSYAQSIERSKNLIALGVSEGFNVVINDEDYEVSSENTDLTEMQDLIADLEEVGVEFRKDEVVTWFYLVHDEGDEFPIIDCTDNEVGNDFYTRVMPAEVP